jgi:hypothetical protein
MLLGNVVIGHSMESVLFAYVNNYYHLQSSNFYPLFFEEDKGFSLFGTSNKKEIWTKIKIMLGFLSLNIDYPEVKQIRIQDNIIKAFDDNLLIDFEFEKCYIFNTMNISHENKIMKAAKEKYEVIDDFKVNRLGYSGELDPVFTKDDFMSEVYFYNSMRIDGSKYITDIATKSTLTKEQLYNFDYSDTMMMFKLTKQLNDMGHRGIEKKHVINKSGGHPVDKLILTHMKRYVNPIDTNKYQDSENVKFLSLSAKEILDGRVPER